MTLDAKGWANWFWDPFFADWLGRVRDPRGGVYDALGADGLPDLTADKTVLAQARTVFTLSHVALISGDPMVIEAARAQVAFLQHFQRSDGLYRCKVDATGAPTGRPQDDVARSYDQSFVILGLVTWHKIAPSKAIAQQIDACWSALMTHLTDPATGLLRNDDSGEISGPAQNPHMHLYEACLQAYRMTGAALWLDRAAGLRRIGLQHFLDPDSGSITEFLTPDLTPLPGSAGLRREVGHQCEWAWLLLEEAELAPQHDLTDTADRLIRFAETYGFAQTGPLAGAVFDAVSATGSVVEDRFLLWPQTEAIKILASRHRAGDPQAGARAQKLLCVMCDHWFAAHPMFVNQLDSDGKPLWSEALTRLMYHLVLALTEGARAGLWPDIPPHR